MPTKKIFLSLFLGVSIFALLAAPLQASACWAIFQWACDIGGNLVEDIARLIVSAVTITTGLIFFLVAGVTNWIITTLINVGVAPGVGPQFVTDGWTFSRNFVNIFFLLILVFIGLATILRLREYELQKTLPRLIVVALLVNFSGLLVGFLADVGNIITVFFTQNITGAPGAGLGSSAFRQIFNAGGDATTQAFANAGDLASGFAAALAIGAALGFFFIFATIAYLAIALVFFLRLVILWVLVILAPFAFLFSILPITRKWWNQWLDALIQWSFITVPLAFFMWLANNVLANPISSLSSGPSLTGNISGWSTLIGLMMSPFVAIVLLFIGLGMSASMSGFIRGGLRFARHAGAVGVGVLGANLIRDKFLARSAKMQRLANRMETFSSRGMSGRNVVGQTLGRAGAPLVRWAGRKVGSETQTKVAENIKKTEEQAKKMSAQEKASRLRGNIGLDEKIGILNVAAQQGESDDVIRAGFSERRIMDVYNSARKINQHQDIQAAFPHFVTDDELQQSRFARDYNRAHPGANLRQNQVTATQAATVTAAQVVDERIRMYSRMKPERVKQISEGAFNNTPGVGGAVGPGQEAMDSMLLGFNGARFGNVASGDNGQEAVQNLRNRLLWHATNTTSPTRVNPADPRIAAIVGRAPGSAGPADPGAGLMAQQGMTAAEATERAQMRIWLINNGNEPLARYLQGTGGQNLF
ncbi:MAG TPA: type IV secretion system protein [Candidatus Paceibacterota bacterium]